MLTIPSNIWNLMPSSRRSAFGVGGAIAELPNLLAKAAQSAFGQAAEAELRQNDLLSDSILRPPPIPNVAPRPGEAILLLLAEALNPPSGKLGTVVESYLSGRQFAAENAYRDALRQESFRQNAAKIAAQRAGIVADVAFRRARQYADASDTLGRRVGDRREREARQKERLDLEKLQHRNRVAVASARSAAKQLAARPDASIVNSEAPPAAPQFAKYVGGLVARAQPSLRASIENAYRRIGDPVFSGSVSSRNRRDLERLESLWTRHIDAVRRRGNGPFGRELQHAEIDEFSVELNRIRELLQSLDPPNGFAPLRPRV